MMKTLFAWLGNTDLRASEGNLPNESGPILHALQTNAFDCLVLLSDHGRPKTNAYHDWLKGQFSGRIESCYTKLRSPTDFEDIYLAANQAIADFLAAHPQSSITFHVSPGTPAMAAVWVLLAKAKYGAHLIESSRERGVKAVNVPFDLAAEYVPSIERQADGALARLMVGDHPNTPEFSAIVHRCASMKRAVALAQRLANYDVSVLIQGESGTGKELFARAIHAASFRRASPFLAVNCGAIPHELVDSELFGHEKGAFTGAHTQRKGYFEAAEGGTLFLDEIGELPLASQVRLLRVLQEREVTRVGSNTPISINVRIIAATNRILVDEIQSGRFREDVFHRLAVGVIVLPPLRNREGDVSLLIDSILQQINHSTSIHKILSVGARNLLLAHSWPGNVRELHNILLRASIWAMGDLITPEDVAESLALTMKPSQDNILGKSLGNGLSLPNLMADVARHYLNRALSESHGNKTEAARLLGLGSYQTLTNWIAKYLNHDIGTDDA